MKYKVITTFKPGDWNRYANRMVKSVLDNWPDVSITVYYQNKKPILDDNRITWIDIDKANPNLFQFREIYKNDPVAMGKLTTIPGGVRRSPRLIKEGGLDKDKDSYLWNAVKFSYKVSCVTHGIRNYQDYDYVIWIDDDTYTFRQVPIDFLKNLCPIDSLVTYCGREDLERNSNKYPECGLVAYNIKHPLVQNFINDWEKLYTSKEIFNLLEWHDSYVFWHMTKTYRKKYNIKVNDIGYAKGVRGHHVFVNCELGLYIDHFKGDRKSHKTSRADDIRKSPNIAKIDYWKNKL